METKGANKSQRRATRSTAGGTDDRDHHQRPDINEDNPAIEPEPNGQSSKPKTPAAKRASSQTAAGLKDTNIAIDSLRQGHWLTCTVIDRRMTTLGMWTPKQPTYPHRFSHVFMTWRRGPTHFIRYYTKYTGQTC